MGTGQSRTMGMVNGAYSQNDRRTARKLTKAVVREMKRLTLICREYTGDKPDRTWMNELIDSEFHDLFNNRFGEVLNDWGVVDWFVKRAEEFLDDDSDELRVFRSAAMYIGATRYYRIPAGSTTGVDEAVADFMECLLE